MLLLLKINKVKNLLFTEHACEHSLDVRVPVSLATQGAAQALVALLVARVTDGVVEVPARRGPRAWGAGATVCAHAAVLRRGGGEICYYLFIFLPEEKYK